MQRSPRSPRTPASLSQPTNHKLNMYTLAASAAGVGVLALTPPAEAKIVYTPTWVEIVPNSKTGLDLNHDGFADFSLSNHPTYYGQDTLKVLASNNAVWGTGTYAAALRAGVRIGPGKRFLPSHNLMAAATGSCGSNSCYFRSKGPWTNVTGRYLGLKFSIQGKIHYGWARFNVTATHRGVYAALTGYAYETVANRPIVTGKTAGPDEPAGSSLASPASLRVPYVQPGSLGLLAQGSRAMGIWRRRDTTKE